jgi:hypothetical protein
MSNCKKIQDEIICENSDGCSWNKRKKCQQSPTKKTKPSSNVQKTHTIRSYFSPAVNNNVPYSIIEDIAIDKLDTPSLKQKTVSPYSPEPCDETEKRRIEASIKYTANEKREWNEKCNKTKYLSLEEQTKIVTLLDLVKYIVTEKIDTSAKLFEKFPETNERINGLSKPYIFEALWKIIFLLELDNLTDGYKREYITALEEGRDKQIDAYDYLHSDERISRVNSGSASGIADFYFTVFEKPKDTDKQPKQKQSEPSACESREFKPKPSDVYIFTSKFYRKEKGVGNYDIEAIALEAIEKYDKNKFKIVSLVRNGSDFRNRLSLSSKEVLKSYVDSNLIFDESDLHSVYYPKLWTWLEHQFTKNKRDIHSASNWRNLLNNPERILNLLDNLRFHQKYVVEYTNQRIEENLKNTGNNPGKFIWGAVARSGKSYMIGGLVAKRLPRYVLLILGAVNETKGQFIDDLFRKYTELKDEYEIIDFQTTAHRKKPLNPKKKYVFVISQENLRAKLKKDYCEKNPTDTTFCKNPKTKVTENTVENVGGGDYSNDIILKLEEILEEPNKVVFFDEIHQGSGEDTFQTETIQFFYNDRFPKPLFIMVSATYAKPLGKYGKEIGNTDIELVEWNYEMIMKMKQFRIEHVTVQYENNTEVTGDEPDYLINRNSPHFEEKMNVLHRITTEMMEKGKTCEDISHDYESYPELVYLLPMLKPEYKSQNNETGISKTYTITEGEDTIHIRTELKRIFDLDKQQFKYKNAVNKWLDYIYRDVYNELLEKEYNYVANGEGNTHSQLWFLPTTMKKAGKPAPEETAGIVGPMLKNMGKAIINHPRFTNFDVCVVHSAKETEKGVIVSDYDKEHQNDNPRRLYFKCIQGDVKKCISDVEKEAKTRNKSLIILTAQRLRLGISLPCVDVAIHMDNIQSYDILYQSMFRVLTERPGKTHGYFVDMVTSRAMKFMYKYTQIQQNITGKPAITDEKIQKYVKQNLLLFDVGTIRKAIGFSSVDTPMNSYSDIAREFKLDKDSTDTERLQLLMDKSDEDGEERAVAENAQPSQPEKTKEIAQNIETRKQDVEKLLTSLLQKEDLKDELIKKVKQIFEKQEITTKKKSEKEGTQSNGFEQNVNLGDNTISDNTGTLPRKTTVQEPKKEDMKKVIKHVVEQLKNIFTLFILFNDETAEISDILSNSKTIDVDKIMKCEDPDIMYYCYLLSGRNPEHRVGDIVSDKHGNEGRITHIEQIDADPKKKRSDKSNEDATYTNGGAKITLYTIKWNNGGETKLNAVELNKRVNNSSYIQKFISDATLQYIDLINMLKLYQTKNEVNNLYVIIKEEMSSLKERTKKEVDAFQGEPLENCPETFINIKGNEKVLEIIRKNLTPKENEKNLFGEVFTPVELVCEMLSKLPVSVWRDKNKTWLDPANGIGNFPVVVYYKLMEGLKDEIPNDQKRSKWIIEEMLYMGELNPVNVALTKKVFKMIDPDATPNVIKVDFLTKNELLVNRMREVKKDSKKLFDIIIGNPPYNSGGVKSATYNDGNSSDAKTIWPDFVKTSLSILSDSKSYLLFIHPASWIGFKSSIGDMFKTHQILYLRYYSYAQSHKRFGSQSASIPLTYYLLQNIDTKHDTIIHDNATNKDAEFNIYEHNFVPTESVSMWKKILTFTKKYGNLKENYSSVKNSSDLNNTVNGKYKYPIISIVSTEINTAYSNINNNKNHEKKLLLANSAMGYPIYDYTGIMYPKSSDQFILYSNDNEMELKQLQNYLLTNLLFYMIIITKTRQRFFDNKIFEVIPNITKITKYIDIDDEFLIKTFKLTTDDLVGYNNYIASGEGRLDEPTINKIKKFKLSMDKTLVSKMKNEKQLEQMNKDVKNITKRNIQKVNKTKKREGSKHDIHIAKTHNSDTVRTIKSIPRPGGNKKTRKNKSSFIGFW